MHPFSLNSCTPAVLKTWCTYWDEIAVLTNWGNRSRAILFYGGELARSRCAALCEFGCKCVLCGFGCSVFITALDFALRSFRQAVLFQLRLWHFLCGFRRAVLCGFVWRELLSLYTGFDACDEDVSMVPFSSSMLLLQQVFSNFIYMVLVAW